MSDTYQSKYTGVEIDERLEWAEGISPHMEDKGNPHEVTAAQAGAVPITRKVNNKALSDDITLTPADVSAVATANIVNTLSETAEGKVLDARQGKALKDLVDTNVGDLETLTTTDKSSLVNATNEVKNLVDTKLDVAIPNIINNGNFASGTMGWLKGSNITNFGLGTEGLIFTGGGPLSSSINNHVWPDIPMQTANDILYVTCEVIKRGGTASVFYVGNGYQYTSTSTIDSGWVRASYVGDGTNNIYRPAFGASPNITVEIKNALSINLTTVFGAGNEPTLSEMDTLMGIVGWWDGTLTPTMKQILNWELKMIRQNRAAIIALGGTIV